MLGKNFLVGRGMVLHRNGIEEPVSSEITSDARAFNFEDIPARHKHAVRPSPPEKQPPVAGGDILRPIPLEGVVTIVQRTEEEPPPNWYRTFSKIILTIIFLPIFVTFGLAALALSIAFAIIGFQALSAIFNPVSWLTAIFEFMEVFVLGRLQRSNQHTVYRGLVRDSGDRISAFYLHGVLRSGLLVDGHRVRLFGEWRRGTCRDENERGTLFVSHGEDLTTGSSVSSFPNRWRPVFFVLLAIFLGVLVFGAGYLPQLTQMGSALTNSIHG